MRTLTIIDTFGFFFRSYYALPPLRNSKGFPTGLLMGFANLIHSLYQEGGCEYLAFALEGRGVNRRKLLDSSYKSTRQETPQELLMQLPIAIEWIEKMGFSNLSIEGYEADDVIASLSKWALGKGLNVRIVSHDKDLYQLISEGVHLYDPIKKKEIHTQECLDKWGVYPKDFVAFQSLLGDSSDNVKGVKGIGAKSAQRIINHYHSLDALYADEQHWAENKITPRLAMLLKEGKESAYLSQKLVKLHDDLITSFSPTPFPKENPLLKIIDELETYDFDRLILRVKKQNLATKRDPRKDIGSKRERIIQNSFSYEYELLNNFQKALEILRSIPLDTPIAYDCETDALETYRAKMVGFSFCVDQKKGYYVPLAHNYLGVETQVSQDEAKELIGEIFKHPIIGHNLKFDYLVAKHNFSLTPQKGMLDSMLLAWLYDSGFPVGLDRQMLKWFDYKMLSFDEVVKKGENFSQVVLEEASRYACEDAVATYCLYERLKSEFENQNLHHLLELAYTLEFPMIKTLAEMESEGIKIDVEFFESLRVIATKNIAEYSSEVFSLAQETFNLNSPSQLSIILFEKLGLQGSKQVKGGYSTQESVLEKLVDIHPIITPILRYREANKLRNTYIDPLLKLAKQEDRVFTSFLQTGTATGRLSSKSPNLQNIPVRTEAGKKIRQGFIAREGNVLLSVDYSQIELRLLAHFSQDPSLIQSFKEGKDIHAQTALKIFGSEEKRAIAKSINFGLIYGMGAKKLAETLKISLKEAKEYIQNYFENFPTVKNFLKFQEESIQNVGYAQTLLGHRRYFDFRDATDFQKANYLREGINSIFQGSAADLIKLSMNKIGDFIEGSAIKMLIQVHDELIFELPEEGAQEKAKEIAEIMNGVYTLRVPLECGVALGKNWAELK
ncbi:DNA polymerase I [Helicobacter cholecystus]|uniref:DNA polymerase I n=1 Tax=Helicobacter cholecystus TaxID=45498 RepID=A0A3D8IXD3_9HELI|nr:DNA polymerase I [Helicobacter cholecystus]RDU69918.1 DNA polymerase I [Helicobacter cholecystus]VEJ25023.1 DNA polymerase I [Helicobacter cholecystus]